MELDDFIKTKTKNGEPLVIVLCGLPGAGKSALCTLLEYVAGEPLTVLSTDNVIQITAEEEGTTYDAVWERDIKATTKAVNEAYRKRLDASETVIWDRTNLTKNGRRKLLAPVPKDYAKICIHVTVHEDLRQKRIKMRPGKTIPDHVDTRMRDTVEVPTEDEGFDHVFSVVMGPPHTGVSPRGLHS